MIQLSQEEARDLVSQNVIPSRRSLSGSLPYAFTQEGVAMLSAVLNSQRAVQVSIAIMRAFVRLREYLTIHKDVARDGWAIAKRIQQVSQEALQIQQGSLYPALHRLEQQAWIKAGWRPTETGRMAKFYSLTRSGRKQLERELANWVRLSTAINIVVQEA